MKDEVPERRLFLREPTRLLRHVITYITRRMLHCIKRESDGAPLRRSRTTELHAEHGGDKELHEGTVPSIDLPHPHQRLRSVLAGGEEFFRKLVDPETEFRRVIAGDERLSFYRILPFDLFYHAAVQQVLDIDIAVFFKRDDVGQRVFGRLRRFYGGPAANEVFLLHRSLAGKEKKNWYDAEEFHAVNIIVDSGTEAC